VQGKNLVHALATPAQGKKWSVSPCQGRGVRAVTARNGHAWRHDGEVTGTEPEAQVASGLHNREEEGAGVVSGKFTAAIAHLGDGAASGSGVGSVQWRLVDGEGSGDQ
jgi:hypothetical protein